MESSNTYIDVATIDALIERRKQNIISNLKFTKNHPILYKFTEVFKNSDLAEQFYYSVGFGVLSAGLVKNAESGESIVGKGAVKYEVDPSTKAAGIKAEVLKSDGYIKNPTAQNIKDLISDSGKIGSSRMSGEYMYVVDTDGNIIIGTRAGERMPHPTLIGGKDPQVLAAGIVDIRGGLIYKVDNASGHYKPSNESLQVAQDAFGQLPQSAFSRKFQGFVPFNQ